MRKVQMLRGFNHPGFGSLAEGSVQVLPDPICDKLCRLKYAEEMLAPLATTRKKTSKKGTKSNEKNS